MANTKDYAGYRSFFQDISNSFSAVAATDDTTLVTVRNSSHTLYIQKLHIEITGASAGKTWTFKDSAGTPVNIVPSIDTTNIAHFDFDFGARGVPCTEGKNFLLDVSAAGAAGWITWEGYSRLTSAVAAASA